MIALGSTATSPTRRGCILQKAYSNSVGEINTDCGFAMPNRTYPMSYDLSSQMMSKLSCPTASSENHVPGSLNCHFRWSGEQTISANNSCYEDEECSFRISWSNQDGFKVIFSNRWSPKQSQAQQDGVN
ncbi:hypothetical protein DSO57_1007423 [Entomophthora muscae]|uniref:Uncharacterized protein n=1 Tax=Entomophthora muscae TaxID=34485 RepID=A0ACC2T7D7_9FUNG|nr:hypothetical protein DSO57_1007423 [Entomophthora muscae]